MIGFDPLYLVFLAPAMLLGFWAQSRIQSAYARASQIPASSGWTGAEAARHLLDCQGLTQIPVEPVAGTLSDHYDPEHRVLRLSEGVYGSHSVAALGIAAHEVGHAYQHAQNDAMLSLRNAIVPLANIGSGMGWLLMMIGFVLAMAHSRMGGPVVYIGIAVFSFTVLFQVVNLPVEFDASSRARRVLLEQRLVEPNEDLIVGDVLGAAAWTYVAATLTSVSQVLYFLMRAMALTGNSSDDNRG